MAEAAAVEVEDQRPLYMERGVGQLLFNYLPDRTVDWEDGAAIVQLTNVRLQSAWSDRKAQMVRHEVAAYIGRWKSRGGIVSSKFPDLLTRPDRITVGEPVGIAARVLDTALICRACARLVFRKRSQLAGKDPHRLDCPSCGSKTLRQFGQVFVHGCGELVPVTEWLPQMPKGDDGKYKISAQPLRCQTCGDKGVPELPARSERARDMTVSCRTCRGVIAQRLTARCPACAKMFEGTEGDPREGEVGNTPVARVLMRLANYRANDAYYPHALTILRLDRPETLRGVDDESELLRSLLPAGRRPGGESATSRLTEIVHRIADAEARGDQEQASRLRRQLVDVATGEKPAGSTEESRGLRDAPEVVLRSLEESLALKQSVSVRNAEEVLATSTSASSLLAREIADQQERLGIRRVALVDDLPIIAATFGYTRRTFDETYNEDSLGAANLPTQLRSFYPLAHQAARRLGRADLAGTIPILAREGEHEGIFLALDPSRVVTWLVRNGVAIGTDGPPISRIIGALEDVDRYYDRIWDTSVHRYVFGLIHSLSHAAMRVISRLAGLDRTSVGEYLFIPLLGVVIYSNAAATRLGNMETVIRDHLLELLSGLAEEGLACLYDPDCLDRRGACHGCLHAPEICCRVFNHGLSRSFLQGGHVPWIDSAIDRQISGYW